MSRDSHSDRELNLSNANRGVWLVKVPKYVANRWEKAPSDMEVGKLKIAKYAPSYCFYSFKLFSRLDQVQNPKCL